MKLHVNEVAFRGNSSLPEEIKELSTPVQIFRYFFTKEIMDIVVEETNRCALSQDTNTSFSVKIDDIYHYIGIQLFMSVYRYPNLESYWGKNAFEPIRSTMTLRRFGLIKKYLCFQDENDQIKKNQPEYDPLIRMRPFATQLNDRFDSVPKTARLCVDEVPIKSHKLKLFVLCDSSGYVYRFETYNGAEDSMVPIGCPDIGSSANVVVRLTQTVPDMANHILYFDKSHTSLPLLVYLLARGIYSFGKIRANRIQNCKLPSDSVITEEPRGYSTEFVGRAYGVEISTVLWKDNESVRLASTFVGVEPFERGSPNHQVSNASRIDGKKKQPIENDYPQIINEYNSHIRGVDSMDELMGRYRVRAKTHDAVTHLFYHFIDMAATNAYILYRRIHTEKLNESSNTSGETVELLQLPEFRKQIAAELIKYSSVVRSSSRPSTPDSPASTSQEKPLLGALGVGRRAVHPDDDVRYSGHNHFPIWLPKSGGKGGGKQTCKNQNCKSQTQCVCSVCNLHLCCSPTKNCFLDYHTRK